MIIHHQNNVTSFAGNYIWYWPTQPIIMQQISVTSAAAAITSGPYYYLKHLGRM